MVSIIQWGDGSYKVSEQRRWGHSGDGERGNIWVSLVVWYGFCSVTKLNHKYLE